MNIKVLEIRQVASRLRAVADTVSSLATGDISRMKQLTQNNLQGLTANSIKSVLSELGSDFTSIASGLRAVSNELFAYARRVEEADARAKSIIANK
jgi:uncharacterized protein YukE